MVIENNPAIEILRCFDSPDALHYVDPPYPHSTRTSANAYRHEMSDEEHIALSEVFHRLQGSVVISSYPSPLYEDSTLLTLPEVRRPETPGVQSALPGVRV